MKTQAECEKCQGDRYIIIGCCNGRECGCLGFPIDAEPCNKCNKDGLLPASESITEAFPRFFGEQAHNSGPLFEPDNSLEDSAVEYLGNGGKE